MLDDAPPHVGGHSGQREACSRLCIAYYDIPFELTEDNLLRGTQGTCTFRLHLNGQGSHGIDTTVLKTEFRRHDAPPTLRLLSYRVPDGDIWLVPRKAQMARLAEPVSYVVPEAGHPLLSPGAVLGTVFFGRVVVQ